MSFSCDAHKVTLRTVFKDELEKYVSDDGIMGIKVCRPPKVSKLKGIKQN